MGRNSTIMTKPCGSELARDGGVTATLISLDAVAIAEQARSHRVCGAWRHWQIMPKC